ncbi:MAG TPA: hypothetical protein VFB16_00500 [Bauldia sp.]|nr:hypothetical protein [Bauldia sp.]
MTPARRAFWTTFVIVTLLGAAVGVIKLIAPEMATVTLNGENVEGGKAILVATGIGAVVGLLLGLIVAGIVAVFSRRRA